MNRPEPDLESIAKAMTLVLESDIALSGVSSTSLLPDKEAVRCCGDAKAIRCIVDIPD